MTQKDQPPSREDVVREDYEKSTPDDFKDKWGIPDDPATPPPPSQDPAKH